LPGETLVQTAKPAPSEQPGFVDLLGQDGSYVAGDGFGRPFGLDVASSVPLITPNTPTYAVMGWAGPTSVVGSSYGVYAAAGADSPYNYALYGFANTPTGWAGYFEGNVNILPPFDLIVGTRTQSGPSPTTGEICINNMCRSTWPTSADSYWADATNALEAINTSWGLAAGGKNGITDAFYVQSFPSNNTAELTNNGTASSNTLTIQ
jgi:hypothetical protein